MIANHVAGIIIVIQVTLVLHVAVAADTAQVQVAQNAQDAKTHIIWLGILVKNVNKILV